VRTWDQNRAAINQLWPMAQFTDEEKRLWHDDLSGIDQDVLYDALRNVKRSRDSLYPQLPWILQAYRELFSAKRSALKATPTQSEPRLLANISDAEDKRLAAEFVTYIDSAQPSEFESVETMVLDNLPKMLNATAHRVIMYARKRLLGQEALFGKVASDGEVQPIKFGAYT
jgi:hypothetical protein